MHYYEVWVASQRYHSEKPLTYAGDTRIKAGTVVIVPLQLRYVAAIVVKEVKKPPFRTKEITRIISPVTLPDELLKTIEWMKDYYPAPFGQIIATVLPGTLAAKSRGAKPESDSAVSGNIELPPLTDEQNLVIRKIIKDKSKSVLLHGDTGTGKTRIYLELAKKVIADSQSAIILTPEIGLTPQLAQASRDLFPKQTIVIHSKMGAAARRDIWLRILEATEPLLIIGPRSALFTPVKNVGLIAIDESHETAYKQEQAPHYQATRVGAKLAKLHNARFILASATPSVSDYFVFSRKRLPIVRMRHPAIKNNFAEPAVEVIDIKDRQHFTKSTWLSDNLINAVKEAIRRQEQALVFLNRRGTARLIACQLCGWQALCPNCDLPLIYHDDKHILQCHTCGHSEKSPLKCASCGSTDIIFRSAGTKSVVNEIKRLISDARIARFDSDNTKMESLEQQYSLIKEGAVNVLVGTQMLGKGLDLPKLATVGIVTAESSLFFPDYTAEERTYQLITQALGRINRGYIPGAAVIQTYHPDSSLLRAAIEKDYTAFYDQQVNEREHYRFPPFCHTLKLSCSRTSRISAERAGVQLKEKILASGAEVEVIGPNPAFLEKTHNVYHWQLIIRAARRHLLTNIIHQLPANWSYDIDPMNLL